MMHQNTHACTHADACAHTHNLPRFLSSNVTNAVSYMQLCRFLTKIVDGVRQLVDELVRGIWIRRKLVDDLSYPAVRRRIRRVSLARPHAVGHQSRDRAFHRRDLVAEIPVPADQVALSILDPRYHVRQK